MNQPAQLAAVQMNGKGQRNDDRERHYGELAGSHLHGESERHVVKLNDG